MFTFKRDEEPNRGMIAIAGSKGGCGTSTVTLGLAEAFARADTSALAVDADRQLPNLHVLTDVDREPTAASLLDGGDARKIAQPHPREPNVGILPAPKSGEPCEFETLSDRLKVDGIQTLIDCPSGAGPDLVDPIRQADGTIVVATNTDRGLEAAETTIEIARRLGVPVYGAILNKCQGIPTRARGWEGVPLLGAVPDRPSPLDDDDVVLAFDQIVRRLSAQSPTDRARPEYAGDSLPLGTDRLDRHLGGGVPTGVVVALIADPASQAEHLLYRAAGTRGTLYISTERSRANVRRAIDDGIRTQDVPTIRQVSGEDSLDVASGLIDKLPRTANVIVDSVDEFERCDRPAYRMFLDGLKKTMVETESLAILHCVEDDVPNRSLTLRCVDAVFELETVKPGIGTDIAHYLSIPKYRPDATMTGTLEIPFGGSDTIAPIEAPPGTEGGNDG